MRGDIEGGAIDALARGILRAREIDAKMEAEREKLDAKVEAEREKKIATLAKMEAEREKLDAKVEAAKEKNGGSEGEENRHVGKDGGREAEVGCKGGGREGEENRKGEENCKIVGKDGGRGAEVGGDREDTRRVPPGCNAAVEEERQNVLQRARDRERWSEVDALVEARMLQGENEILKDHLQQCERQVGRLQSEVARLQSGAGVRSSTASGARGVPAHSASGAREEEEAGTMPGENGTHLLGKRGRERYRDAAEAGQDGEGTPERDAPAAKRGGHAQVRLGGRPLRVEGGSRQPQRSTGGVGASASVWGGALPAGEEESGCDGHDRLQRKESRLIPRALASLPFTGTRSAPASARNRHNSTRL
eukprot:TRINITY_DN3243_c0_g1_i10.p1 TRINITY_DN3243_c0_g1~~TRINITY_DN3243_c0_g1_i10.p1  ORF type:complete len:364 (-),score=71.91 TRINITY_DN3243_c0_g1_i10:5230-6321(-)